MDFLRNSRLPAGFTPSADMQLRPPHMRRPLPGRLLGRDASHLRPCAQRGLRGMTRRRRFREPLRRRYSRFMLPIHVVLEPLKAALAQTSAVVLAAPPGAGKTTV